MRKLSQRLSLAAVLLGIGLMAAGETQAFVIIDPVEDNDGWVVTGNTLHFIPACCGTSPTAGLTYLHIQNLGIPIGGRDASKSFPGNTLVAGGYTVTFDIGDFKSLYLLCDEVEHFLLNVDSDHLSVRADQFRHHQRNATAASSDVGDHHARFQF